MAETLLEIARVLRAGSARVPAVAQATSHEHSLQAPPHLPTLLIDPIISSNAVSRAANRGGTVHE
jgi:hypothetical protein